MRLLIAGATGSVGFELVRLAKTEGHFVRSFSRSPENARRLRGLADEIEIQDGVTFVPNLKGIDAVASALGAAVTMASPDKRRYREVDFAVNANLLKAALEAGVGRFVYVSAHLETGYRDTAYIRAHEEFVDALRRSGISYSVIRPTAVFPALNDFVRLARKGLLTVIGDGKARTNPVHQADVARVVLEQLTSGPAETSVGGSQVFTRNEVAGLAFQVLGKRPRLLHVPPAVFRVAAKIVGLANPRVGELFEFVAAVTTTDCVAPALGQLRLEDHFRTVSTPGSTPVPSAP
jgi:uncharacterized protein YbjT (DUF2867 family)